MISATLAFVQDATRTGERTKLEVASLVETVMDEAAETRCGRCGRAILERAVVDGDPIALKRLVTNLVDNALKFGSSARGRLFAEAGMAVVEVDDNGPSVPGGRDRARVRAVSKPGRLAQPRDRRRRAGAGGGAGARPRPRRGRGDVAEPRRKGPPGLASPLHAGAAARRGRLSPASA